VKIHTQIRMSENSLSSPFEGFWAFFDLYKKIHGHCDTLTPPQVSGDNT